MSREAELYKDKIEVSLDGRQIFYLFFGGAVIVGLVFVLGVMVGRRVEARGHTDRARVAATVDPLAALDRLEGGSGLSFQGALRGDNGPVSDVEKTIANQASAKASGLRPQASVGHQASGDVQPKADAKKVDEPKKSDEPKLGDSKKVEPAKAEGAKPEPKKIEPAKPEPKNVDAAKPEPKQDDAKKDEPKVEAKKDELKKDAVKPDPKAEAKLDKKDEAKVEAKKDEAKVEAKKDEAKAKFVLQLSSFQDKAEAQAYLDSISKAGFTARITEGTVDGKQYFRIRMGSYKTIEAANDAKVEFEKAAKKSAIVIKL